MQHWLQLATRNWRAKQVRTLGAVLAIMLGTATVVWVTCCFESVRRTVFSWAAGYVGASQITIQSPLGKYDTIAERMIDAVRVSPGVARVNGTLVSRLRTQPVPAARLAVENAETLLWNERRPEVDLHGIVLETELPLRPHQDTLVAGRMLAADDGNACLLEASFAEEYGVGPGDRLFVWGAAQNTPAELEIVGLVERKRIGRFQKGLAILNLPVLQKLNSKVGRLTLIEVVVDDANTERVQQVQRTLRPEVQRITPNAVVRTVESRMKQISFAQRQQEYVLLTASCVVMLTALVTILSTLSMGMIERIGQLGLMRCIGLTGGQLAALMLLEVLPIGALGIALGLPTGLLMTWMTVWAVPDYVGGFAVSLSGLGLAVLAGVATTLAAAVMPMIAALRVAPLDAARAGGARSPRWVLGVVGVVAAAALITQHFGLIERLERTTEFFQGATLALVLLYVGYALCAPVLVGLLGGPIVALAAGALRIKRRLLADQVGHAVWRSAGVCCGLMVGLSLIVGIVVVNESVISGWRFPSQFPEAYIWSFEQITSDAPEIIGQIPGVKAVTAAAATNAIIQERRPMFMEQVLLSTTWFMGCDPDSFFDLVRVEMVEGDHEEAMEKMRAGGHVIVAQDFAAARNKHLGDSVTVYIGNRMQKFTIAGVMQSPALDIAAGYFQAHSEFIVAASGSVLGTRADMKRFFGVDGVKLILINFDLPPTTPPPGWPPPRGAPDADGLAAGAYDTRLPLERRWRNYREMEVLREARQQLNAPQAYLGTARELKDEIDSQLTQLTRLLTAVPGVALVVAALGVANLMAANVTARARQIAILRAVGATRSLVLRMVVGEALVLGLLGSGLGLLLGLHLSSNVVTLLDRMWGFRVALEMPWTILILGVVLTNALCIVAGVLPARRASRTNVVDALRVL